jgi:ATP-dependent Clp protease ATP-binding subunit ClpX
VDNKIGQGALECSFCGKDKSHVDHIISGRGRASICYDCVRIFGQLLEEGKPPERTMSSRRQALVPRDISGNLDAYVVSQDKAKKILSVAVYNHYKRIWIDVNKSDVELKKTNILMVGPTGCGKTLLAETLARILDVPFAVCDATSLTESGYVGEDVENILLRLIQAADWDVSRAEHGIIYIDELDKIARKEGVNRSITRDVSGEGVQQELLKIIEGCIANVPPQGGRKHPHQELLQINTRNILFICGGAFDGLSDLVSRRRASSTSGLGFLAASRSEPESEDTIMSYVTPADLLEFGFIPELVGRLPVVVALDQLDREALIRVLTEPKNAIVKEYQNLFSIDGVELEFTQSALEAAADSAVRHKTGARSLRYIIESTLLEVMYEMPSLRKVARCIVDSDAIVGSGTPLLINSVGEILSPSFGPMEKSA